MNRKEALRKFEGLLDQIMVTGEETYKDVLEDLVYLLEEEITKTKNWIYENPELKLNIIEREGYLRGLFFLRQILKTYDCVGPIYEEYRELK